MEIWHDENSIFLKNVSYIVVISELCGSLPHYVLTSLYSFL